MIVTTGMTLMVAFILGSMLHVYKFRGQERYESFTEYLRKGWFVLAPVNCLLYLFTKKRGAKPIMDLNDFPELKEIQDNWEVIRDEVMALHEQDLIQGTKKEGADSSYDLGFRTFYKYGWSKFYVTWYGTELESAQKYCPKTLELIKKVPSINGAMFSHLPPGSKLTRHLDPTACSLRYHLGLTTPNDDKAFINIDGTSYSWRDGDALLFDETYLHYAINETDKNRLILMLEVNRPTYLPGTIVNFFYKMFAKLSVVPNMEGDSRGLINAIFATLAPAIGKMKALKQTNRPLYKTLKYTVNFMLMLITLGIAAGLLSALNMVISA
jgi:beta-hydroxylase